MPHTTELCLVILSILTFVLGYAIKQRKKEVVTKYLIEKKKNIKVGWLRYRIKFKCGDEIKELKSTLIGSVEIFKGAHKKHYHITTAKQKFEEFKGELKYCRLGHEFTIDKVHYLMAEVLEVELLEEKKDFNKEYIVVEKA